MVYIEHTKGERYMEKIIEVNHLSKSYGDVRAVKDVSFNVEQGMLFAFLGPNGAGKSTTINCILYIGMCADFQKKEIGSCEDDENLQYFKKN